MNQTITEFSTMGSCSSRNIFNSSINKNYKDFFKINRSLEGVSLISLMSKPIEYDNKLINSNRMFDNVCVIDDLSKTFLDFIKEDSVDYIILDTFIDVSNNVIQYSAEQYLTLTNHLESTDLYNLFNQYTRFNIFNDFKQYYELWTKSCNEFFDLINHYCNRTKIILNCSRSVYKYIDSYNNIKINDEFKILSRYWNPFRNLLDKYILDNFDVEVLPFDSKTYAYENYIFGLHSSHFEPKYFSDKNKQLLNIIKRNENYYFNHPLNIEIRNIKKNQLIQSFEMPKLFIDNNLTFKQRKEIIKDRIENSLSNYNTARIDIKNFGNAIYKQNNIKLTNISDENITYYYPDWFKNSEGKGVVIQSKSNFLNFDVECIGNGKLKIMLRGMDIKLHGKTIPAYIKFTDFSINDEKILNKNEIVSHDEYYVHTIDVQDKQIISLYFEWLPVETLNLFID